MINGSFSTGFWVMLGVLGALLVVTLLMTLFRKVA